MWSVSDDALLAGFALGDSDAAITFVERFQRRVYGLAITILSEPRAATAVAEAAFVEAARRAGTYDPRTGSVAVWLMGLTRRLALERVYPGAGRDPDTLIDLEWGAEFGPDEPVGDIRRLQATLGAMAPETRRALLMAMFEGSTVAEIAAAENIPRGMVINRLRSALLTVREAMVSEES